MMIHWPIYMILIAIGGVGVLLSYKRRGFRAAMLLLLLYIVFYCLLLLFDVYIEYTFASVDSEIIGLNDPMRIPSGPFRYALGQCFVFSKHYVGFSILTAVSIILFFVSVWRFIVATYELHKAEDVATGLPHTCVS